MIWITQWLCSRRHCAIAVAWDDQEMSAGEAERRGEQAFAKRILSRWCGICGGSLHIEHGRTKFNTMEEVFPRIKAIEQANLRARSIIGGRF